ncbi:phosphoglycolate phosphatase [Algibacillus agarilyticus]|uniref:phosphoglycolate phosphatase n=1 Tax=Algibacillus agarilyticus TaxID=2234133 RepID=UPI000DCF9D7F|nr:phosphoglycolate phosphatase [Algibacillus agarilyticus]
MIKLIVFDLDGTLIDSLPSINFALDSALTGVGYPAAGPDKTRRWIGNGSDVLVARGLSDSQTIDPALPSDLLQRARGIFNDAYQNAGHAHDLIYPDVAETLGFFAKQGYKMAVLTNKTECFIEPLLVHFGIAQFFEYTIAGNTLPERKPSPMGLHWLCDKYQFTMDEVVMVGDSENDINAAQAAGCQSVGLTYGYNYDVPIASANPTFVIDKFAQLRDLPLFEPALVSV